jgi:parallel beta-helix repeat protein
MRDVRMRIRAWVLAIVCSLLVSGTLVIGGPTNEGGSSFTPHSTIYIFGNEDFVAANGVTGGNGTELNPFVIEGWEIEAGKVSGITIRETTANFVIRNVFVHSAELTYFGISLRSLVNGRIEASNITGNWMGVNVRSSNSLFIEENNIADNEEGLHIKDSKDMLIKGNRVESNGPHDGLVLANSSNITIQANTFSRNERVGALISSSNDVSLINNEVRTSQYEGVLVSLSNDVSFTGNLYADNPTGLRIFSSSSISTSDSEATRNAIQGMHFESSSFITVDLSRFIDNDVHGIHVSDSDNVSISRSIFRTNQFGTYISTSRDIQLTDNTPFSNGHGVYVGTSSKVTFSGNEVYDGWVHGIVVTDSNELSFTRNRLHSNNADGIRLTQTTNSTVTNNIFSENLRGVFLENSVGIVTFHNEFKDNTNQVRDNKGNENSWESGYPTGGNHWSDYVGADQFQGPDQNESDPDGIGDVPYDIDSNSRDFYPLISPPWNLPSAPENLQASWGDGYVNLTWIPPGSDGGFPITKYKVYRRTGAGGEIHLADEPWFTYFNDTTVENGERHYFRVAAVNGVGEGPKSNEAASIPTAVPEPPSDLKAVLSGNDKENVAVNWSLSMDDGSGQGSVIEYKVFRGSNFSSDGDGYQSVANLMNGSFEFEDGLVGEGDPNNYFYRVCAVDVNNKTRCSDDQVGKFARSLAKGPNLVSVPLMLEDSRVDSILGRVPFSEAWFFDSVNKKWSSIVKSKPYGQGTPIIGHTHGFWLNVTEDSNLTVAGLVPSAPNIFLTAGWNLVGFPSFNQDISVGDVKSLWTAQWVEGCDSLALPYNLQKLKDSEVVLAGYGYWVWVESSGSFPLG